MDKRLAFIGGGNIAQAILSGLVPTFEDPRTIMVADPSEAQGVQCKALGATWTQDNLAAVAGADVVLLCVKPQLCLLYTSPSPRDKRQPRMPSSA